MSYQLLFANNIIQHLNNNPDLAQDTDFLNAMVDKLKELTTLYDQTREMDKVFALQKAVEFIDLATRDLVREKAKEISCRKGCSFCCHWRISAFPIEGQVIIDYCRANGISIDKNILRKQARIPDEEFMLSDRAACIFLKDGLCSIYPVRPIVCRKYLVGTEPQLCDAKTHPKAMIGSHFNFRAELMYSAMLSSGERMENLPRILLNTLNDQT